MWQPRFRISDSTIQVIFLIVPILLVTGCGPNGIAENSEVDSSKGTATQVSASPETMSVVATKSTNSQSPAALANEIPGVDVPPGEVCQRFMNLLQSGNRMGAEALLSRAALAATTRAGLKLEPMGGPMSVYEIGEVRFATNQRRLAQVDCTVVDQVDQEEYRTEVTWQLHKFKSGWRISGVMLQLGSSKIKDLLSFENIQDVTKLQYLADAAVLDETEEPRQAKATVEATTINK